MIELTKQEANDKFKEFYIPQPPKEIFRSYKDVVQNVTDPNEGSYVLEKISYTDGIRVFINGSPFPKKGFPFPEAISAINIAKRAFLQILHIPLVLEHYRVIQEYIRTAEWSLKPLYLEDNFLTPVAREMLNLNIQKELVDIFAHIIEYDDAYRYRLQDICGEVSRVDLFKSPYKEGKRLLNLIIERENQEGMKKKWAKLKPLLILLVPFKRKFLRLINDLDFNKMVLDEADKYWVSFREDYNYGGKTLNERMIGITPPNMYLIK